MSITIGSAFVNLVDGVKAYFAANAPAGFVVDAGFRARAYKGNQDVASAGANRVVFIPADLSGNAGSLTVPRQVGHWAVNDTGGDPVAEVRPIVDWDRPITMSVWAVDVTVPIDQTIRSELAQIAAVEALLEWAVRAVTAAVQADVVWGAVKWVPPADNAFGLEVLVTFTLQHPLFDLPFDVGTPGFTLAKDPPA